MKTNDYKKQQIINNQRFKKKNKNKISFKRNQYKKALRKNTREKQLKNKLVIKVKQMLI